MKQSPIRRSALTLPRIDTHAHVHDSLPLESLIIQSHRLDSAQRAAIAL